MARDEVTEARQAIGLPADRFAGLNGGVNRGMPIVCKCIHCDVLFASRSHDLADVDYICRGDCGQHGASVLKEDEPAQRD